MSACQLDIYVCALNTGNILQDYFHNRHASASCLNLMDILMDALENQGQADHNSPKMPHKTS